VLFVTHHLDAEVVSEFAVMREQCAGLCDVALLYDDTRCDFSAAKLPAGAEYQLFSLASIQARYTLVNHARRRRRRSRRRASFVPGNHTFPILHFQRRNPGYEFIWRVEYDVRFSGDWAHFFGSLSQSHSDLLTTTLCRRRLYPHWIWWDSLHAPLWSRRKLDPIRGYLPVCRLSRKACEALDRDLRRGWRGHDEVAVPTLLASRALILEDIGSDGEFVRPGQRNRFYTNTPGAPGLAPGSFVCPPWSCDPLETPNRLYHAVKPRRLDLPSVGGVPGPGAGGRFPAAPGASRSSPAPSSGTG
jgi:hypothetical protein